MNLLVEHGEGDSHVVVLLSIALILSACSITTQVPAPRTDASTTATLPIEMRPLSPTEKTALAKTLSRMLPNPNAAQFKWLPVARNGTGPIGYCGLVNVTSSSGEYIGFRRFFALISKGPGGDYIKGQIEHIDGIPLKDNSTNGGVAEPGLTQENCKEWGYNDVSGAT